MSTLETYPGCGPDPGNLLPSPDTPPTYLPVITNLPWAFSAYPCCCRGRRETYSQTDTTHHRLSGKGQDGHPKASAIPTFSSILIPRLNRPHPPPHPIPPFRPPPTWHHPPPCLVWHLPCLKANHFPSRAPCPPIHPAVADQLWQERQHLPLDRQHLPRLGREQTGFAGFGILNRRGGKILAVPLHPPAIVCVSHSAFHPPPSPRCLHSASFPHLPPTKAPSITSLTPSPERQRRGRADPTICTSQATGPRDLESWPNMSNG